MASTKEYLDFILEQLYDAMHDELQQKFSLDILVFVISQTELKVLLDKAPVLWEVLRQSLCIAKL